MPKVTDAGVGREGGIIGKSDFEKRVLFQSGSRIPLKAITESSDANPLVNARQSCVFSGAPSCPKAGKCRSGRSELWAFSC